MLSTIPIKVYIYGVIASSVLIAIGYYNYIQNDRVKLNEKLNGMKVTIEVANQNAITDISNKENSVKFDDASLILSEEFEGNESLLSKQIDKF